MKRFWKIYQIRKWERRQYLRTILYICHLLGIAESSGHKKMYFLTSIFWSQRSPCGELKDETKGPSRKDVHGRGGGVSQKRTKLDGGGGWYAKVGVLFNQIDIPKLVTFSKLKLLDCLGLGMLSRNRRGTQWVCE